jgi:hypothetical protein
MLKFKRKKNILSVQKLNERLISGDARAVLIAGGFGSWVLVHKALAIAV